MSSAIMFPWRCQSCAHSLKNKRAFAVSAVFSRSIQPESPRYIDVPQTAQPDAIPRPRIKGRLPLPRDIFPRLKGGVERVTKESLKAVTPSSNKKPSESATEFQTALNDWKRRMAERRKTNLREGLTSLQERRRTAVKIMRGVAKRKTEEAQRLRNAPLPDHIKYTRSSVTQNMSAKALGNLPDPNREQRVARKIALVQAKEAARLQERQDALHSLYMHARTFIINEQQLDKALDDEFGTIASPRTFGGGYGLSLWDQATPESLNDKLQSTKSAKKKDIHYTQAQRQRMRYLAESLTGGKIEESTTFEETDL